MEKKKKSEDNLRDFGGNKKWNNICIIGLRNEEGEKGPEKLFEDKVAKISLIWESKQIPRSRKPKRVLIR